MGRAILAALAIALMVVAWMHFSAQDQAATVARDNHTPSPVGTLVSPSAEEIERFVTGKSFSSPKAISQESFGPSGEWSGVFTGIDIAPLKGKWVVKSWPDANSALCISEADRDKRAKALPPFCRTVNSIDTGRMSVIDQRFPDDQYDMIVGK
ncbi:MAG: hypothetical protein EOP17_00220 [Rhizobiaceae bacterium]|nr:MAG: hypothetical protein EOP17_00220 [Rhizobiaceae bacterium]